MLHALHNPSFSIESVLHPTDFSRRGDRAFAHALAIALTRQTKLTLLHVGPESEARVRWSQFPQVRRTLVEWGVLKPNSPRSAVFEQLNIRVKKVAVPGRRPAQATAEYLERHPADLIVLGTEGRSGLPRWIDPSVAEPLARAAHTMTLFVPSHAKRSLIGASSGDLRLRNILLPVDRQPDFRAALAIARSTAETLGKDVVKITLAHVGSDAMHWPTLDDGPYWRWQVVQFGGDPVGQILAASEQLAADLIVMPTAGHHGILDLLRGSTTEQVLRMADCPVLAVPAR